jgi:hypothetical protein
MSPLNVTICTTISYTLWVEWYYKKQLFDLEVKGQGPTKVIMVRDAALWSCTPNIIDLSRDKNIMARTRKYYLKNHYLILRSKIKVQRRSLRYATHRLMVMHIRTIFQWTVLLDLFELFDLEVKGQGPTKVIAVRDTPPYGHAPTYQLSLTSKDNVLRA